MCLHPTNTASVFQNPYKIIFVVQLFGLQDPLNFLHNMKRKENAC